MGRRILVYRSTQMESILKENNESPFQNIDLMRIKQLFENQS